MVSLRIRLKAIELKYQLISLQINQYVNGPTNHGFVQAVILNQYAKDTNLENKKSLPGGQVPVIRPRILTRPMGLQTQVIPIYIYIPCYLQLDKLGRDNNLLANSRSWLQGLPAEIKFRGKLNANYIILYKYLTYISIYCIWSDPGVSYQDKRHTQFLLRLYFTKKRVGRVSVI